MYIPPKRGLDPSQSWNIMPLSNVSLDAAGLVAIAEITTIPRRTALTGSSVLLDSFILCPGIHRQQSAVELNGGEYPAAAAMTTGYVFRVENPATVMFLQKVGVTGHLTTLKVSSLRNRQPKLQQRLSLFYSFNSGPPVSHAAYFSAVSASLAVLILLILEQDWWGVFAILLLILARLCNVLVIRRRCEIGWKGAKEPNVQGDLLILLSQDRWLRMQGTVDDLKAVTSGQWLRDRTFSEDFVSAFATLLVYLDATLVPNVSKTGQILLLVLMIVSAALLSVVNGMTMSMHMHGLEITVDGEPRKYNRRLDLAMDLIEESKREDWAFRLGMIVRKSQDAATSTSTYGPVLM